MRVTIDRLARPFSGTRIVQLTDVHVGPTIGKSFIEDIVARRNPRVDVFLWFLLRDEERLGGWQSGLTTAAGKRKASFRAFQQAVARYGT